MGATEVLHQGEATLSDLKDGFAAGNLLRLAGGTQFFLDPTNGNDSEDGLTPETAFLTLTAAYAKMTDGKNDVLYYIPGTGSINLAAQLVWAKSYCHFVGLCAPVHAAQRCRIFQLSTATGLSPLIKVTGSGNVFGNLYIFQGVNDATSLLNIEVDGNRNYFYNVHFAGGGHAAMAIDGCASLYIAGGSENLFDRCTIGVDTIGLATGGAALVFATTPEASRNVFRGCLFSLWASNNGAIFAEVLNGGGVGRYTLFDRCKFLNTGTALLAVVAVPAGIDPTNKKFFFEDCVSYGAAKWDANDRGFLFGNMGAVTGADLSGSMVQIIS